MKKALHLSESRPFTDSNSYLNTNHVRQIQSFNREINKLIKKAAINYGKAVVHTAANSDWSHDWLRVIEALDKARWDSTIKSVDEWNNYAKE